RKSALALSGVEQIRCSMAEDALAQSKLAWMPVAPFAFWSGGVVDADCGTTLAVGVDDASDALAAFSASIGCCAVCVALSDDAFTGAAEVATSLPAD
ncbi:hypothetical protein, partial [Burkholderia pseudomallei]|uniref:hypothetical protein n=1 Tax=Burkholderia pseudomallei TaxID=28450 RepID=UPI001C4C9E03